MNVQKWAEEVTFERRNLDCWRVANIMRKDRMIFTDSLRRLFAVAALAFFLLTPVTSWACTTIVVGKDASATGNILLARTEDLSPIAAKRFVVYPAGYYKRGFILRDDNGFEYTFTHDSYKFTGTPDMAVNAEGLYDAHGTNEHGIAVTATNSTAVSTIMAGHDPLVSNGIQEPVLATILLAEASTVSGAITLAGNLVERYGASESFVFVVADQNEVWLFEAVSGHRWVASRVPDDSFVVVANDMVTDYVVLSDDANYRGRDDVAQYVVDKGVQLLGSGGRVNIAGSYGRGRINMEYNSYRRARGYNMFASSQGIAVKKSDDLYPYSMFVKPDRKIGVTDIMNFQRDRYQNTANDMSASAQAFNAAGLEIESGSDRPVGSIRQMETHIYEMVKGYPAEIGARWWMAMAQSEHSVNLPFYGAITDTHPYYKKEAREAAYEPESAYWIFGDLAYLARGNRVKYGKPIQDYWRKYELKLYDQQASVEKELLSVYSRDKAAGRKMITDYTIATSQAAMNKAAQIRKALLAHIAARPNELFSVPSDLLPFSNIETEGDLTSSELALVANLLGLAPSRVTEASLGAKSVEELGWSGAPDVNGYTTLSTPGLAFSAPLISGNTAKFVYSVEIKGDDYAYFGNSVENVKKQFALFRVVRKAGASDDVRMLVGPGGTVSLSEAISAGIASVYGTEDSATVTIRYYLYDGAGVPKYGNGILAVPDGAADGYLTDVLWVKKQGGTTPSSNTSSGGSGGCSTGAAGMALFILLAVTPFGICRRKA